MNRPLQAFGDVAVPMPWLHLSNADGRDAMIRQARKGRLPPD